MNLKISIKNLLNGNLKYFIFILAVFLPLFCLTFYHFGDLLYDTGREFLVPCAINSGKTLIKDVFISYFPLSYQINTLLFKIFGSSFNVLRITGVISAISTVFLIYLCAAFFAKRKHAFLIALAAGFVSMFNVSYLFNYVMGMSYAFVYAVLFLFISIYFALFYIKENKFLYFAFFSLGVCFAFKVEFVFLLIPYIMLPLIKKENAARVVFSFLISLIPLFLSFSALFIQGLKMSDFLNYFNFLKNFINAPSYKKYSEIVFNMNFLLWIGAQIKSFLLFLLAAFPFFIFKRGLKLIFAFLISLFLIFVFIPNFSAISLFAYLFFPLIYIAFYSFKNKNLSLFFLSLVSMFLLIRVNFIFTVNYSAFLLPVSLLSVFVFINEAKLKPLFNALFSISIINIVYFLIAVNLGANSPLLTDKGKFIPDYKTPVKTINRTIRFMKNLGPDKSVLILPEGAMFNYLAGRKTNLKYYQLLPNHIELLGEKNIIEALKKEPSDYILISNLDYSIYGTPAFCKDFGLKICAFIEENYNYKGKIDEKDGLTFLVFVR